MANCPTGTFADNSNNECTDCHTDCVECTGDSELFCISCADGFYLQNRTECKDTCPDGYYKDSTNNECSLCDVKCTLCEYNNTDSRVECTGCADSYFLNGIECVNESDCDEGYFANTANNTCDSCHSSCTSCINASNNCQSCKPGYLLFGSSCVNPCPNISFLNDTFLCQKCSGACAGSTTCKYGNNCS